MASTAGYAVLAVYQAFTLPERVPGHVGVSGEVTWPGREMGRIAVRGEAFGWVFWVALGVYVAGVIGWTAWWSRGRRWKPPALHP